MAENEQLGLIAKLLDSLNTYEKLLLISVLAIGAGFVFGGGVWVGSVRMDSAMDSIEAGYERKLAEAEREAATRVPPPSDSEPSAGGLGIVGFGIETSKLIPPDDLPTLEKAPLESASLVAFLAKRDEFLSSPPPSLKKDFYPGYFGRRFVWSGFLAGQVEDSGLWDEVRVTLQPSEEGGKPGAAIRCSFHKEKKSELRERMLLGERSTIAGVMDNNGELRRCEFVDAASEDTK